MDSETTAAGQMQVALGKKTLSGLDAGRAFAITAVIAGHYGAPVSAGFGVVLFFVLSGFLITRILLREAERSRISLRRFYLRRTLRIFPAFYVCWALTMLQRVHAHQPTSWPQALLSFCYLGNYGRAVLPEKAQVLFPMGISWSLAIEEHFYLIWPALLAWMLSRAPLKSDNLRHARRVTALAVGGIWLFRFALVALAGVPMSYVANATECRADALLVGCLMALGVQRSRPAIWAMYPVRSRLFFLGVLAAVVAIPWVESFLAHVPGGIPLLLSGEAVLAAVLVWQLLFWSSTRWSWLEAKPFQIVARLSYSLYLYHPLASTLNATVRLPHIQRAFGIVASFAAAALSYFLVERPFLSWRDRTPSLSAAAESDINLHLTH